MKRDLLIYLAGRFIPAVVNLAVIILAIRFLGPEEYGRYSLILYAILLTVTLSFHWIQVSILRFLASMPRETKIVMSRFFYMTLLSSVMATILIGLVGIFYFHLRGVELGIVLLFAFFNHFYLFHLAILQAYHRSIRAAILEGADNLIVLLVLLSGLFFFQWNSSMLLFSSYLIGFAGAILLRFIIRVKGLLMIDMTRFYWDGRFSGKVFEVGFGIALWLFFSHLMAAADRFIIYENDGMAAAGNYSAMKDIIFKGITFAAIPIFISYQSKIMDHWNAHRKREALAMIKEGLNFQILIFIIIFIVFMVAKSGLFQQLMFIPEAEDWQLYLPVLFGAFLWQIAMLFQRILELIMHHYYLSICLGCCVVINIVANIIFVPRHGPIASSIILFATITIYTSLILLTFLKKWKREQID